MKNALTILTLTSFLICEFAHADVIANQTELLQSENKSLQSRITSLKQLLSLRSQHQVLTSELAKLESELNLLHTQINSDESEINRLRLRNDEVISLLSRLSRDEQQTHPLSSEYTALQSKLKTLIHSHNQNIARFNNLAQQSRSQPPEATSETEPTPAPPRTIFRRFE